MRAIICSEFGPPSALKLEDIEMPEPKKGEVRVRIVAASLNFFDTLIIKNMYQFKPPLPFSPGAEMAGTVDAVGEGVADFKPGDRVVGNAGWGCCAEMICISAQNLIAIPQDVSFDIAAGLTVTYGTSLHALKDRGELKPAETIAVLGAAGGVGQAAVELAKIMGARVIACASSDEKLQFCKEYGADDTVNYAKESLKDRLKELTGGNGVDVVYDPVGGDLAESAIRATAWLGRFLVVGFAAGEIPRIPLNLALLKGLDIRGVFWGSHVTRDPQSHRSNMTEILGWVSSGQLKPHIYKTYALEETPGALQDIADRKVMGKVIIRC